MSEEAAQPEGVEAPVEAPLEGLGAESQSENDLYTGFLDGVSPEIHEQVIPALKAQDAEFTKRFQSLSEKTKPFDDLGVFDSDPETVGSYLSLAQAVDAAQTGDAESQKAVYEWWDQVGEQLGFYEQGEEGEDGEGDDSFPEDFDPYDAKQFSSLLESKVQETIAPLHNALQDTAQVQEQQEALAQLEAQVKGVQEEHGLSNEVMDEVQELAAMFPNAENPIQAGYEKYQSLIAKGEGSLFQKKIEQPQTPEGSGPANTTPEKITSANVREIFRQRLDQEKQLTG